MEEQLLKNKNRYDDSIDCTTGGSTISSWAYSRKQLLQEMQTELQQAQIEDAATDAWLLFEHVLSVSRAQYYMDPEAAVSLEDRVRARKLVKKRCEHIPLQYILGEQQFMGLDFEVNEAVLVPRQETELLVELALPFVKGKRLLDVCTGSGCILLSLAKLGAPEYAMGLELSKAAIQMAKRNAGRLGLCGALDTVIGHANANEENSRVKILESDLFSALRTLENARFDVIVSNPPYIRTDVIETLSWEVKKEPHMALDGGEDGLDFYRRIAAEAGEFLVSGGHLFMEIGYDQGEAVSKLLEKQGFCEIEVKKDYAGLDRIVGAVWP